MQTPSVLVITTQTWLQVTRLAMRFCEYGCKVSVICPGESHLTYAPYLAQRFRFRLTDSLGALRHAILASRADYVLPTDDMSVWFLHELAEQTPALRPVIERSLGNRGSYALLRSRLQLLRLARTLGIAVPETEPVHSAEQLDRWEREHRFPCVLKKDGTWGGRGVQVAGNAEQARQALTALTAEATRTERAMQWLRIGDASVFTRLRCLQNPELTAQSFVSGVPANAMFACAEGRILGEVQARVIASEGKRGPALVIHLIDDARISHAGAALAKALQLSGFFGLDFMLDGETGEPLLIELNPRSTQLGHVALANQPDLAGRLWAHWTGSPLPPCGGPELGQTICFYPKGEQLTRETASVPGSRPDVAGNEAHMVSTLLAGNPALGSRIRGRLWRTMARLKGSLRNEAQSQAYFYQNAQAALDCAGEAAARPPAEPALRGEAISVSSISNIAI